GQPRSTSVKLDPSLAREAGGKASSAAKYTFCTATSSRRRCRGAEGVQSRVDRSPCRQAGDSWAEPCAPDEGTPPCPSDPCGGGWGAATAPPAEIPAGPAVPASSTTTARTRFSPQPERAWSYARFDTDIRDVGPAPGEPVDGLPIRCVD